jgi:hypothetical protein
MTMALAIALGGLLLCAEPPAPPPAPPRPEVSDPADEELLRNLELVEQLELLERFELLVPEEAEEKQPQPPGGR